MSDSTLLTVLCASSDSALHEWIFIIYSSVASAWAFYDSNYWYTGFHDEVELIQDDQIEDGEEETFSRDRPQFWKDEQLNQECEDGAVCAWDSLYVVHGYEMRLFAS